jgi:pimeloyl-ACP methyl ester carboxylesterase
MEKFELKSINKIFENRKDLIPEVGRQFEESKRVEIEINGEKLEIDYRIISVESLENKENDPVILIPGFGSGWEGVSELGFSLACEGRKVIMPSFPGSGNSSNPSEKYYDEEDFDNEAEVVNQFIDKLGNEDRFHLIGHSMGGEIMARVAEKYPEKVSSLVLLNPAGVESRENAVKMGSKFVFSGIQTSGEFHIKTIFSGEKDYEKELRKYIPKIKSSFSKNRIFQRLSEWKKLSKGHLLEKIKNIETPITYISGELDMLFPAGDEKDENSQLARIMESVRDKTKIEKSVMARLRHNTTVAPDEITAANIDHYLEIAEKKNRQ